MEHIYLICSLDCTLQILYICSIRKIRFFKGIAPKTQNRRPEPVLGIRGRRGRRRDSGLSLASRKDETVNGGRTPVAQSWEQSRGGRYGHFWCWTGLVEKIRKKKFYGFWNLFRGFQNFWRIFFVVAKITFMGFKISKFLILQLPSDNESSTPSNPTTKLVNNGQLQGSEKNETRLKQILESKRLNRQNKENINEDLRAQLDKKYPEPPSPPPPKKVFF